jgi:dihydrofolate synthase/folylpolyglutamate synthase
MDLIPPNMPINLEGAHQRRNANLALAAVEVLNAAEEINVHRDAVWRGLENVRWPGRLETASEDPWILLDGAHNPDAMRMVREYLEETLGGRRLKVLFGAMADKEIGKMLAELAPLASEFLLAGCGLERAAPVGTLQACLEDFEGDVRAYPSVASALAEELPLLAPGEALLITGSFYVVGEARRALSNRAGGDR